MANPFTSLDTAGVEATAVNDSPSQAIVREEEKELVFDLALVMAGAVSAGAYTAGVIDYLLEALDAWEEAKEKEKSLPIEQRTVPFHKVRIKVLAGASAGGMTAAMMAATFRNRCLGITEENSIMKECWLDKIDLKYLLESRDIMDSPQSVRSILDSSRITKIANDAFAFRPPQQEWKSLPYLHNELKLYLTLSNLRGLPYEFNISGETGFKYGMMKFTDYEEAIINKDTSPEQWLRIRDAAMATGAFPVGLSARLVHRDPKEYIKRCKEDNMDFISIKLNQEQTYSFACVDGGVFNNEPLELARKALYSSPEQARSEASAIKAAIKACSENDTNNEAGEDTAGEHVPSNREYQHYIQTLKHSLILIDPFPNVVESSTENDQENSLGIFNVLPRLIGALRRQALFKPEELLVASHRNIYSSFMISPIRYTSLGLKADYPIASGFLEGFGGFFLKLFRKHDYQLGRRNCQRFLQKYFTVPAEQFKTNPLFSGTNGELLAKYQTTDKSSGKAISYYPIIPLVEKVKQEEPQLEWPGYDKASFHTLIDKVNQRVKLLLDSLLSTRPLTRLIRHSWMIAWCLAILFAGINFLQYRIRTDRVSGEDMGMFILQGTEIVVTPLLVVFGGASILYWYARKEILRKIRKVLRKQLVDYALMD